MASSKITRSSEFRFAEIPQNEVLNNIKESGLYWCNGVRIHSSAASLAWGMLIVASNSANNAIKQYFSYAGANAIMARYYNGTWSDWTYVTPT